MTLLLKYNVCSPELQRMRVVVRHYVASTYRYATAREPMNPIIANLSEASKLLELAPAGVKFAVGLTPSVKGALAA